MNFLECVPTKKCTDLEHKFLVAMFEGVKNADLTRMAKLIKIVGMPLQSKVYLFWRNPAFPET